MPRPRRPLHIKSTKEGFSAPAYIVAAAKLAAGHPEKDFSPWVVAAIKTKLERENPGLIESTKADLLKRLENYQELPEDGALKVADEPERGPWALGESPRELALKEEATTAANLRTKQMLRKELVKHEPKIEPRTKRPRSQPHAPR